MKTKEKIEEEEIEEEEIEEGIEEETTEEETEESQMFNSIKSKAHKLIGILYYSYCIEELKNIRQFPDLLTDVINISEILKPWTTEDAQYRSEAVILQIGLLLLRGTLLMLSKENRAVVLAKLLYQDAKRYSSLVERKNPEIVETLRLYLFDIKDKLIHTDSPNWLYVYYNAYCGNDNKQEIIQKALALNVKREPVSVDAARFHEAIGKFYKNSGRSEDAYKHLIAARNAYIQLKQQEDIDRVKRELTEWGYPHTRQSFFPAVQDAERLPDSQRNKIKSKHCCLIL